MIIGMMVWVFADGIESIFQLLISLPPPLPLPRDEKIYWKEGAYCISKYTDAHCTEKAVDLLLHLSLI